MQSNGFSNIDRFAWRNESIQAKIEIYIVFLPQPKTSFTQNSSEIFGSHSQPISPTIYTRRNTAANKEIRQRDAIRKIFHVLFRSGNRWIHTIPTCKYLPSSSFHILKRWPTPKNRNCRTLKIQFTKLVYTQQILNSRFSAELFDTRQEERGRRGTGSERERESKTI